MNSQVYHLRQYRAENRSREAAIRARIVSRTAPPAMIRPSFVLRAGIVLAIGCAAASGLGSILGFLAGAL